MPLREGPLAQITAVRPLARVTADVTSHHLQTSVPRVTDGAHVAAVLAPHDGIQRRVPASTTRSRTLLHVCKVRVRHAVIAFPIRSRVVVLLLFRRTPSRVDGTGWIVGVAGHVRRQTGGVGEPASADAALVRTLAGVRPDVPLQRRRIGETLRAHWADVGPFACVRAPVDGEVMQLREGPVADVALVWPLARVTADVTSHHLEAPVLGIADVADVVPSVAPDDPVEAEPPTDAVAAGRPVPVFGVASPRPGVTSDVSIQRRQGGVGLPADEAGIGPLAGVGPPVDVQLAETGEGPRTHVARVRSVGVVAAQVAPHQPAAAAPHVAQVAHIAAVLASSQTLQNYVRFLLLLPPVYDDIIHHHHYSACTISA